MSDVDSRDIGETVSGSGALPVGNGIGLRQLEVFLIVRRSERVRTDRFREVGKEDEVTSVLGSKSRVAFNIEELRDLRETIGIKADAVRRELQELGSRESVSGSQRGAELLIVLIEQINGLGAGRAGSCRLVVHCRADSEVDGAHNELIDGDRHLLVDLVVEHRDEGSELSRVREGLLDLKLGDRELQLESDLRVEELRVNFRLDKDVRIVGRAVGELPRRIGLSVRQLRADLLHDGTEFPSVHKQRRNGSRIGAVDKDHFADVIDKTLHVGVDGVRVKDRGTDVDDVREVSRDERGISEDFSGRGVDERVNLFNIHWGKSPFN